MDKGMLHLYWGEGKGKTTAAMGLALRALGQGLQVVVVQFLKQGTSGELAPLTRLGATVLSGKGSGGFLSRMDPEQRRQARAVHNEHLRLALMLPCDVLILDEACAACQYDMVEEELVRQAVRRREAGCEVVLTGRYPAAWMREMADYSTEMVAHAHPYAKGLAARRGIEY